MGNNVQNGYTNYRPWLLETGIKRELQAPPVALKGIKVEASWEHTSCVVPEQLTCTNEITSQRDVFSVTPTLRSAASNPPGKDANSGFPGVASCPPPSPCPPAPLPEQPHPLCAKETVVPSSPGLYPLGTVTSVDHTPSSNQPSASCTPSLNNGSSSVQLLCNNGLSSVQLLCNNSLAGSGCHVTSSQLLSSVCCLHQSSDQYGGGDSLHLQVRPNGQSTPPVQSGHPHFPKDQPGYPCHPTDQPGHPCHPTDQSGHPCHPTDQPGHPCLPTDQPEHPCHPTDQPGHPCHPTHGDIGQLLDETCIDLETIVEQTRETNRPPYKGGDLLAPKHVKEITEDSSSGVSSSRTKLSTSSIDHSFPSGPFTPSTSTLSATPSDSSPCDEQAFCYPYAGLITPLPQPNPSLGDEAEYMLKNPLRPPRPPLCGLSEDLHPSCPVFQVLTCCYRTVHMLLQDCSHVVTGLFTCCYRVVTGLFTCCYGTVHMLLQGCSHVVTGLFTTCCYRTVDMLQGFYRTVHMLLQGCLLVHLYIPMDMDVCTYISLWMCAPIYPYGCVHLYIPMDVCTYISPLLEDELAVISSFCVVICFMCNIILSHRFQLLMITSSPGCIAFVPIHRFPSV